MALPTIKLYECPLPKLSHSSTRFRFKLFSSSSSLQNTNSNSPKPPSAPWLHHWDPPPPLQEQQVKPNKPPTSIERIVHRLRSLELGLEEDVENPIKEDSALNGNEKLGELLERNWTRADVMGPTSQILPWDRYETVEKGTEKEVEKKKRVRAPTLAELTIEDEELRRLRRLGMGLRERVSIPKAGLTSAVLEKIHGAWRREEIVRLKFHEDLAHDMKTAHEIVERRTGGLVVWRAGSVMVVYRGANYKRPSKSQILAVNSSKKNSNEEGTLFIPDVLNASNEASLTLEKTMPSNILYSESMTEEEKEFDEMLDGLGPRFVEWWGTGLLPVDADLLSQTIPNYKTPVRMLPTGMRSRLTNAEMTNLRKLARKLPCHFALGRNRQHQGLASAILNLWEKSLVVKIAVKRGIQNTNNKIMAEELKNLTGGTLLLRNKYYIVMYRGKDFVPTSVATVLAEREELTKDVQEIEEKARNSLINETNVEETEGYALAGTLAEFQEAQARWGREVTAEEQKAMKEEATRAQSARLFKKFEHKFNIAQAKKMRAEKLLSKIEASMVPVNPSDDQEMITDEEQSVFRRIGLQMKSYLPLGIRGVFDGVIENMHLHWKHRELVKLISKQKTLSFVEDTARLLEYESGGILVAIERVPKGFAIIYYRGKNYQRPYCLRPRNLLTKAKALKRAVAMQRHEALSQHISQLESTMKQMKLDLGYSETEENDAFQSDHSDESDMEEQDFFSDADDSEFLDDSEDDDNDKLFKKHSKH